MNNKIFDSLILGLIIIIVLFFRLYKIETVPPSLSLDEVSIGYNAYSILKTGKDEYDTSFPLVLRAYDDFRPSLYVYLVIPFVKIFGLRPMVVRLPSVILSVISVIATFYLGSHLIGLSKKIKDKAKIGGFFASLFLALSPWNIYLSRLGHEANAGISFLILSYLFFFKKKYSLFLIFLALSFMSYQSEKIIVPILTILTLSLFWRNFIINKKKLILTAVLIAPIIILFLAHSLNKNGMLRFQATSIFAAKQDQFSESAIKLLKAKEKGDIFGQVLNNRRVIASQIFFTQYFSHFNPTWLLTNNGSEPHKVPNLGLIYPWEAIFLMLGLLFLMKSNIDWKVKVLIIGWILVSIIPAAITTQAPHAMRTMTVMPMLQIIEAFGIISIISFVKKEQKFLNISLLITILLFSSFYFYNNYFNVFPIEQSASFNYSLSNAIPFIVNQENNYSKIIISNENNLYQSYMFFLFYSRFNPILYQKLGGTVSGGYAQTHKIGKIEFRPIHWNSEKKETQTLLVGNPSDFPKDIVSQAEFPYLNGQVGVKIISL